MKNLREFHKEWTEPGVSASRATTYRRLQPKVKLAFDLEIKVLDM